MRKDVSKYIEKINLPAGHLGGCVGGGGGGAGLTQFGGVPCVPISIQK